MTRPLTVAQLAMLPKNHPKRQQAMLRRRYTHLQACEAMHRAAQAAK